MDFSQEELIDTIERLVNGLLERAGVEEPPVDALHIAEEHLGIPVEEVEPEEDDETGRRPRRRGVAGKIALTPLMSEEQKQKVAADGIAWSLYPDLLRRLGVAEGSEDRRFAAQVRGLIVPRILVPSRLLRGAQKTSRGDLFGLKSIFTTASLETIAMRLLDLDEPCVITIADDGVVTSRRGNRFAATRQLESAETECLNRVMELDLPHRVRKEGWTAQGWPVADRPLRRVILRAVPDDWVV
jgi:hypothetical protein